MLFLGALLVLAGDTVTADLQIDTDAPERARRWVLLAPDGRVLERGAHPATLKIPLENGGRIVCSEDDGRWVRVVLRARRGGTIDADAPCVQAQVTNKRLLVSGVERPVQQDGTP